MAMMELVGDRGGQIGIDFKGRVSKRCCRMWEVGRGREGDCSLFYC